MFFSRLDHIGGPVVIQINIKTRFRISELFVAADILLFANGSTSLDKAY
jgi:hypothetical protein